MNSIDLTPLYRNSIGFDHFGSLLDNALRSNTTATGNPPYNIEVTGENRYAISIAVAGYEENELEIQTEKDVLTVTGKREDSGKSEYLYKGIKIHDFEQKFNLADYIEVKGASLKNGLLTIDLVKELPEAMKPRKIEINSSGKVLEHKKEKAA